MSKSGSLLLYQYPESALWENYGQFWNDVSASSVSTAVQDPACGLDFYDTRFLWNLGVTNQNHQEGQFASAAVTIPDVEEAGAYSIDTAFQTTWQSSGYSHPSFDFEAPGDYTGPVIGQTAATAGPDDANNEVIGEFQSASQSNWSSATSYSTLHSQSRRDLPTKTGKETNHPATGGVSVQESQKMRARKSRISRLDPLTCEHCRTSFRSTAIKRFRYVLRVHEPGGVCILGTIAYTSRPQDPRSEMPEATPV